jgi:hypothetical protein
VTGLAYRINTLQALVSEQAISVVNRCTHECALRERPAVYSDICFTCKCWKWQGAPSVIQTISKVPRRCSGRQNCYVHPARTGISRFTCQLCSKQQAKFHGDDQIATLLCISRKDRHQPFQVRHYIASHGAHSKMETK